MGETGYFEANEVTLQDLSVSSNGSTWVKPFQPLPVRAFHQVPFSILERIDVGETKAIKSSKVLIIEPFSILERIDVGETQW